MIELIFAIDVGNSNITIGIFDNDELIGTFRMTTKIPRTSDEYGIFLESILISRKIDKVNITDVIIASVVPNIMYSLINGIKKYFLVNPIIVGPGIKTGIKIVTANPREVGADRIVDAAGGYYIYGGPVFVLDFGTATTYDLINEDATFSIGITAPGIKICANALWNDTAKLPEIEIKKPDSILARDTISSMQAGLVYGYIGQTEYIVNQVKKETGINNLKVVATGGLGKLIADETDSIDIYDANLTLKGLNIIYKKQRI